MSNVISWPMLHRHFPVLLNPNVIPRHRPRISSLAQRRAESSTGVNGSKPSERQSIKIDVTVRLGMMEEGGYGGKGVWQTGTSLPLARE